MNSGTRVMLLCLLAAAAGCGETDGVLDAGAAVDAAPVGDLARPKADMLRLCLDDTKCKQFIGTYCGCIDGTAGPCQVMVCLPVPDGGPPPAATCHNGMLDPGEVGIDCGGQDHCPGCIGGTRDCRMNFDCASGDCAYVQFNNGPGRECACTPENMACVPGKRCAPPPLSLCI